MSCHTKRNSGLELDMLQEQIDLKRQMTDIHCDEQPMPEPPSPSNLSFRSDHSIQHPLNFSQEPEKSDEQPMPEPPSPSNLSFRSDHSIQHPLNFSQEPEKSDEQPMPEPPSPSNLSFRSDHSIQHPLNFSQEPEKSDEQPMPEPPSPSNLSFRSDHSIQHPLNFSQEPEKSDEQPMPEPPSPSNLSFRSDHSIQHPLNFSQEPEKSDEQPPSPSNLSFRSDHSIQHPLNFSQEPEKRYGTKKKICDSSIEKSLLSEKARVITGDPQCIMCLGSNKNLFTLPCTHKYCKACADKVMEELHQAALSVAERWDDEQRTVLCDFCIGKKFRAVRFCQTCPANLCNDHVKQHSTLLGLQNHLLGDFEKHLCLLHSYVLGLFCKTDQKHICRVCAEEEHKNHNIFYSKICGVPHITSLLKAKVENMNTEDFKNFKQELSDIYPVCLGSQLDNLDVSDVVNKMIQSFGEDKALAVTVQFLDVDNPCRKVKASTQDSLKMKFQNIFEGLPFNGKPALLNSIYTELHLTEGGGGEINYEHEVRQIEMTSRKQTTQETVISYSDIFKTLSDQRKHIRVVLTKGIAGIGKTVSVQKFILDWADGKANQDIMAIVPLPFRDLNLRKDPCSFLQLLHHYNPELKKIKNIENKQVKLLLIFDGLDECRFPLDFQNNENCCEISQPALVSALLTNLIKGNLLPSALIWITCRPAAAKLIPAECIHRVTEIRGFTETQKEDYFKKINDPNVVSRVINHIKSTRSLHIMCHIPIFCWLSAVVLENMMTGTCKGEIPKTLTEMYTHFLLIQISLKNKKYHGDTTENSMKLSHSDREMVLKLGQLAFQQLEKGNLIFYEDDLRRCGIEIQKASEYSSLCTEIFREESGLYQEQVFSFVHLSIQEHLAALYAHVTCMNEKTNVLEHKTKTRDQESTLFDLHQSAVTRALQCKNGNLDLFLRFLLGFMVDSNQTLIQGLLSETRKVHPASTISYIKEKLKTESSPDRVINLFHCLNELNDNSLVKEIQTSATSGMLSEKELMPDQCSALAYILTMSEEVMEEFDWRFYKTSAAGCQRLLPALRSCVNARFAGCVLSSESCVTVASALKSVNSPLRELDLSYNNLRDSGVRNLCLGLMSPNCILQKLRLVECSLTEACCDYLASALQTHHTCLIELELSDNDLRDSGVQLLSCGLQNPHCKVEKLGLGVCNLGDDSCSYLASALQSPYCTLIELELRRNNLQDSGAKLLFAALKEPHSKLKKLGLAKCGLTDGCCGDLASAIQSPHCKLTELELQSNNLQDSGIIMLSSAVKNELCKLETIGLAECDLTSVGCASLSSALQSAQSLTKIELRDNNLTDSGLENLFSGLKSQECKLENVGLAGCLITKEGCTFLAHILRSKLPHVKVLDLSYNHPGDARGKFSDLLEDSCCKLQELILDNGGEWRMKPGLQKYARQLTLDENTAHRNLYLSDGNRRVQHTPEEQCYPFHSERFTLHLQVLCKEPLSERCYWEVEWTGKTEIGVTYKSFSRDKGYMGMDATSFSLVCHSDRFSFWHNGKGSSEVSPPHPTSRLRVYLDWAAGILSFYSVFSDTLTLLNTYHTKFSDPLYAVFEVYPDSSLTICSPE